MIALALIAAIFFVYPQSWKGGGSSGQKKRSRRPGKQRPAAGAAVDYSKFSHATKQHQEACKTCHKVPTSNWQKARGFPDIADYPDHDACVRCHRQQFFKGAQPAICTDCHTKVSPRDETRFPFRNPERPRQFNIEFPHDKHQDVIAFLRSRPASKKQDSFKTVSLLTFAHADQAKKDYNNCTICHATNMREPVAPRNGPRNNWPDGFVPAPDSFKTMPEAHSACFNCHWKNQEPTKDNCAGCHKLSSPYLPASAPQRISMKFRHSREQHIAECTACHINITKATTLRGLKPDVPITGCTECHNKQGLRLDLSNELEAIDKNKEFVCSYCHTSDVGKRDPPAGHYIVAERQPLKRMDLK